MPGIEAGTLQVVVMEFKILSSMFNASIDNINAILGLIH